MKNAISSKHSESSSDSNSDQSRLCGTGIDAYSSVVDSNGRKPISQARYWIATIGESKWEPHLPDGVKYIKGQLEEGAGGFRHYQVLVAFTSKKTLSQVLRIFGKIGHFEPTRSAAANEYVWKLESRIGEYI